MRLAVLADIHSNFPALQAVLADIETVGVDEIIVAGDAVNAGPFPREVLEMLRVRQLPVLLGNHEQYLLECHDPRTAANYAASRWGTVRWTVDHMSDEDMALIQTWPVAMERCGALLVHGSPGNLSGGIPADAPSMVIAERFGAVKHRWVITAHTHNPFVRHWQDLTLINPGAVGMPLDGNPAASYVILGFVADGLVIQHRRVAYDTRPLEIAAHERGFLDAGGTVAHLLLQEMLTGQPLVAEYLQRVFALVNEQDIPEEEAFELVPLPQASNGQLHRM